MLRALEQRRVFAAYLSFLCLLGLAFILIATSKYGAGVSSDAARNLSTADSLLRGRGFVDMIGEPFVLWPPLYPLVLAGLSAVTRLTTFQIAWYLNVGLYLVNLWLAGWLLYSIFRPQPVYAAFGALVLVLSRSTLRIHANVASEPLFETFMLLFFFAAAQYLKEGESAPLWVMFGLAGLATLQRYLGVVLLGTALVVVFVCDRWRGIGRSVPPLLVSVLPITAWALLHNFVLTRTLFGPRELGDMLPLQNISLSLTKMFWWFLPRFGLLDWLILRPWILVAGIASVLLLLNRATGWRDWIESLSSPYVWPSIFFAVVYFFLLAFTVVTADHLDLTSDRYYVLLLPVVLAGLFITLDTLVLPRLDLNKHWIPAAVIAVAIVWLAYPVYSLQEYLRQALVQGEPTNYNIANSANFREMSVVKAAGPILMANPDSPVYSNYLNIVWFIFGHPVRVIPFEDASLSRDQRIRALQRDYLGWPPEPGYLIWFTPNQYHHIVPPDELSTIADLTLLFEDKTGQIYSVKPR